MNAFSRSELRKSLLEKRKSLSSSEIQNASQKIAGAVCTSIKFQESKNIAFYAAMKGEVDAAPIMQRAWQLGKNCYLPILDPDRHNHLIFIAHNNGDHMQLNHYGILEPAYDLTKVIAPNELDLVITPLVAFDEYGNRLGHGAGFYDRTFAFKNQQSIHGNNEQAAYVGVKPFLLGIAYEWQKVKYLESAPWDVKLDMVVTEESVYKIV